MGETMEIDKHVCVRGPVCETSAMSPFMDCDHASCHSINFGWECRGCEEMDGYVFCETHERYQKLVDQGSHPSFGGTTVYWFTLDCGCYEMAETEYTDY